jgi:hypothetical protein
MFQRRSQAEKLRLISEKGSKLTQKTWKSVQHIATSLKKQNKKHTAKKQPRLNICVKSPAGISLLFLHLNSFEYCL